MNPERAKTHAQPLQAVPLTGRSKVGQTGGVTYISLVVSRPEAWSEPVAIHPVSHN